MILLMMLLHSTELASSEVPKRRSIAKMSQARRLIPPNQCFRGFPTKLKSQRGEAKYDTLYEQLITAGSGQAPETSRHQWTNIAITTFSNQWPSTRDFEAPVDKQSHHLLHMKCKLLKQHLYFRGPLWNLNNAWNLETSKCKSTWTPTTCWFMYALQWVSKSVYMLLVRFNIVWLCTIVMHILSSVTMTILGVA